MDNLADKLMGPSMNQAIIAIIIQVVFVLLWSFLNALILQWRARKLRNWIISYRDTYFISIKAYLAAIVFANAAVFAIAFSGNSNEELLGSVGAPIWLITWWFAHSNALLKLADPSSFLSVKDARAISASVFAYQFAIILSVTLLVLGTLFLIK